MKALFICEDKEEWRLISNLFHAHFPKIPLVCVADEPKAVESLSIDGPFGFVLIDAHMKSASPPTLAKNLLDIAGERPVLYIGKKMMIEDRVLGEIYNESELERCIFRPVQVDKFKEKVQIALNWIEQEEFEQGIIDVTNREAYLPMKIRNFYLAKEFSYDVFLEYTSTKFVKVISKNKPYSHHLIKNYARKGVKYLFLEKDAHLKYLENSIANLTKVMRAVKPFEVAAALETQIHSAAIIHEYLRTVGVTDVLVKFTEGLIDYVCDTYDYARDLNSIIELFPLEQGDLAEQSILTCYFCECILFGLQWNSTMPRRKLGLASLIHDSTLLNDDMNKVTKIDDPEFKMFPEEDQEEFRTHPIKAATLANQFSGFSDVDFIIGQHHELPTGEGFPNGLNSFKIIPLSASFVLANNFVSELAKSGKSKKSILQVLKRFIDIYNVGNFKEPLSVLKRTLI